MKETFTLHANNMSKHIQIEFEECNQIEFDINAQSKVGVRGYSDEYLVFDFETENGSNQIDLSNIKGKVIHNIDLYIYILDAFTSVEVDLEISTSYKPLKLYGDFHCHTRSSGDGHYTVDELKALAKKLNLDFITTTDHNSIVSNFVSSEDMHVIPGLELTNKFGHCNLLGKKRPLNSFRVNTYEQELSKIAEAQSNGAIFVANHPFSPKSRSWLVPILDSMPDLIEIWNGPWGMHNRVAFEWWIDLLNSGKYIPAIGGSDFHFEDENKNLNIPTNVVEARFDSIQGILESAVNGKTVIKNTEIDFTHKIEDNMLKISLTNVQKQIEVYYYDKYNVSSKTIENDFVEEISIDLIENYFVVVICDSQARDRNFLLITNPLIMKG